MHSRTSKRGVQDGPLAPEHYAGMMPAWAANVFANSRTVFASPVISAPKRLGEFRGGSDVAAGGSAQQRVAQRKREEDIRVQQRLEPAISIRP
ncbi:MAG: hypothetical protein H6729_09895 [Deltaproteobacteria bacterium]|nr:hypothetical protein [Deltaproteobacteria bacterium]